MHIFNISKQSRWEVTVIIYFFSIIITYLETLLLLNGIAAEFLTNSKPTCEWMPVMVAPYSTMPCLYGELLAFSHILLSATLFRKLGT